MWQVWGEHREFSSTHLGAEENVQGLIRKQECQTTSQLSPKQHLADRKLIEGSEALKAEKNCPNSERTTAGNSQKP